MAEFLTAIQGRSVQTQQTTFVRHDFNVDDYEHGMQYMVTPANVPIGAVILRSYIAVKTPLDFPTGSTKSYSVTTTIDDKTISVADVSKMTAGLNDVQVNKENTIFDKDRPIIITIDDQEETYTKGEFSVILEFVTAR